MIHTHHTGQVLTVYLLFTTVQRSQVLKASEREVDSIGISSGSSSVTLKVLMHPGAPAGPEQPRMVTRPEVCMLQYSPEKGVCQAPV